VNDRKRQFLAGSAGMLVALSMLFAVNSFFPGVYFPPARIAAVIAAATPGDLATQMIELMGHWALRLMSVSVVIGMSAAAGIASIPLTRFKSNSVKARVGLLLGALFFVAASIAAAFSPEGLRVSSVIAYMGAGLLFARMAAGNPLMDALEPKLHEEQTPLDAIRSSRRTFLRRGLILVGGMLVGGAAMFRFIGRKTKMDVIIRQAVSPFVPPANDAFPLVAGLTPEVTDNDSFYNVDINIVKPSVDHIKWRLKVKGLVDTPYSLDYGTLQSDFEVVEIAHTLTCISNEVGGDLISTAVWRGVRLRDVLERAGIGEEVVDVVFRGAEGYSDSIALEKALEDTTLVVFGMNGEALPREHGFPARIIVPGIYGMKNVKWLVEIELVDHDYQGYWMQKGWSDVASIKTGSRIDVPRDIERVSLPAMAAGIAWAGDRGIKRVEISDDGGNNWKEAMLKRALSPLTWRLWAADIDPGKGRRKILVRAVDGDGNIQSAELAEPHPDGASGLDSAAFEVR